MQLHLAISAEEVADYRRQYLKEIATYSYTRKPEFDWVRDEIVSQLSRNQPKRRMGCGGHTETSHHSLP
jgi:hypothetical protein